MQSPFIFRERMVIMRRRILHALCLAVIAGGALMLSRPARAAAFGGCTEEQWEAAANAANEYCQGATFSPSCSGSVVVVTIISCPKGGG